MGFYLATKSNAVLKHSTTWLNLKNMLREAKWKRLHIVWFCLYEMFRKGKFIEDSGCLGQEVRVEI